LASNPELLAALETLQSNPFWIEYRKRLAALRDAASSSTTSQSVTGIGDIWTIAKNQGSYNAYRAALSLPETITGFRDPEGK